MRRLMRDGRLQHAQDRSQRARDRVRRHLTRLEPPFRPRPVRITMRSAVAVQMGVRESAGEEESGHDASTRVESHCVGARPSRVYEREGREGRKAVIQGAARDGR